jgi:hypothetical protein
MDDETVATDMAALLGGANGAGTVADRYELHHRLGSGGVSDVHEATDTRLDRRVAVKLLRESTASETDRSRFLAEAPLLGRLSHPHLVRVLDAGVDGDRPFLVLELVRGTTLSEALGKPLPPERVAQLGAHIASALAHVHAAGVVHRDVKPGNVLVDENGTAKLADFGIARLVDDTRHHTRTGTLVGTVAYLAPEQVAGERVTTAVDIYALGLVLLEALTGARPYAGTSVESALARLHRPPAIPATLPAGWGALLTAMTARDPGVRPTAAEVTTLLGAGGPVAARPVAARPVAGRQLSARVALTGVAAAFALMVGTAGWTWVHLPSGTASAAAAHRVPATPSSASSDRTPAAAPAGVPAAIPAAVPVAPTAPTAHHRRHHHHPGHHRPRHHPGHHPGHHHGHHHGHHANPHRH